MVLKMKLMYCSIVSRDPITLIDGIMEFNSPTASLKEPFTNLE